MDDIVKNMKARLEVEKGKKIVWAIEDILIKLLKCYYKNKLMNFENKQLSERYKHLVSKINNLYESLEMYKNIQAFDYENVIISLKKFKEEEKAKLEVIAIHENSFKSEKFVKCKRCAGSGGLDHFSYVRGGVCFACEGSGVVMSKRFSKHMSLVEEKKDDLPF